MSGEMQWYFFRKGIKTVHLFLMTTIKFISETGQHAIEWDGRNPERGTINGTPFDLDIVSDQPGSYHLIYKGKSYVAELVRLDAGEKKIELKINNRTHTFQVEDRYDALLKQMGLSGMNSEKVKDLKAPMPGLVLNIEVNGGTEVKKGDPLLILEAMKMENVLKSPTDGVVKEIVVAKGDAVEKNQLLLNFE
jgi:biotin carboxyl carrier protein